MVDRLKEWSRDAAVPRRRGCFVRLLRFVGWIFIAISVVVLAGLACIYVPCLLGVAGACISGVLLLAGGVFVVAFGGLGLLLLWLTHSRYPPLVP